MFKQFNLFNLREHLVQTGNVIKLMLKRFNGQEKKVVRDCQNKIMIGLILKDEYILQTHQKKSYFKNGQLHKVFVNGL